MTERPILFSAPMVRAILEGRKTQTRRIVRTDAPHVYCVSDGVTSEWGPADEDGDPMDGELRCPYGVAGDRLWVRETFAVPPGSDRPDEVAYRADLIGADPGGWTPSIHMPRWASRLLLEVTEVRVQRLQDISERDAQAEGVELTEFGLGDGIHADQPIIGTAKTKGTHPYTLSFAVLWDTINGDRALWISNPWVWVVSFRRVDA